MNETEAVYGHGLSVGRPLGLDAAPAGFLRCSTCGELAKRRNKLQVTCGKKACQMRRYYARARRRPEYREANRRRCAAWYAAHREEHIARVVSGQRRTYGGARGPWFCGPHAVDAWRERYDPTAASYEEALGHLINECERAHFVKALDTGPQLWRGPKPRRARFIVSVCSEGPLPVLETVLPPFDGWRR